MTLPFKVGDLVRITEPESYNFGELGYVLEVGENWTLLKSFEKYWKTSELESLPLSEEETFEIFNLFAIHGIGDCDGKGSKSHLAVRNPHLTLLENNSSYKEGDYVRVTNKAREEYGIVGEVKKVMNANRVLIMCINSECEPDFTVSFEDLWFYPSELEPVELCRNFAGAKYYEALTY